MATYSCLVHPKADLYMIRQEFVEICAGNHAAAALLQRFEFWTNGRLARSDADGEYNRIKLEGGAFLLIEKGDLWFTLTIPDLQKALLELFGKTKIIAARDKLIEWGFLEKRPTPYNHLPNSLQYRLKIEVVQAALCKSYPALVSPVSNAVDDGGEKPMSPVSNAADDGGEKPVSPVSNAADDGGEKPVSPVSNSPESGNAQSKNGTLSSENGKLPTKNGSTAPQQPAASDRPSSKNGRLSTQKQQTSLKEESLKTKNQSKKKDDEEKKTHPPTPSSSSFGIHIEKIFVDCIQNSGKDSKLDRKAVAYWLKRHQPEQVRYALRVAAEKNALTWGYITGIFKRRDEEGWPELDEEGYEAKTSVSPTNQEFDVEAWIAERARQRAEDAAAHAERERIAAEKEQARMAAHWESIKLPEGEELDDIQFLEHWLFRNRLHPQIETVETMLEQAKIRQQEKLVADEEKRRAARLQSDLQSTMYLMSVMADETKPLIERNAARLGVLRWIVNYPDDEATALFQEFVEKYDEQIAKKPTPPPANKAALSASTGSM